MSATEDFVEPLHDLAEARAEGTALRQSVLVLDTSLRHLALEFLTFAAAFASLLFASVAGLRVVPEGLQGLLPGLCVILAFGTCAFLVQYFSVRRLRAGTGVLLDEIKHSISESLVVAEQK